MVFITSSGEVVPDSDPRAKAARGGSNAGTGSRRGGSGGRWGGSGGRGSIHGGTTGGRSNASPASSSSGAARRTEVGSRGGASTAPNGAGSTSGGALFTDGRLAPVARMLGVEGRYFTTPRIDFLDIPSTEVPIVFSLVLLLLTWLAGWRVLMLAVILWFVYHAQNTPSPPSSTQRGAGRRAR